MTNKIESALDIIYDALLCYCEDCISTEKAEQRLVNNSFRIIEEALKGKQNGNN